MIMQQSEFKTEHQRKKEAREDALYAEYVELTSDPAKSKMAINEYLMKKYDVYGVATLYNMVRRAKQRMSCAN